MAAPIGNQNAKGKETGRKSAYQEKADAELLWDMFFNELSKEEIQKKIKSGKYSLKDVWISKGFEGNEKNFYLKCLKSFFQTLKLSAGDKEKPLSIEIDINDFAKEELEYFAQTGKLKKWIMKKNKTISLLRSK